MAGGQGNARLRTTRACAARLDAQPVPIPYTPPHSLFTLYLGNTAANLTVLQVRGRRALYVGTLPGGGGGGLLLLCWLPLQS